MQKVESMSLPADLQLRGECVVCGCVLTEEDYDRQSVVSAIGPEGTVVICVSHLTDDSQYKSSVKKFAEAKAKQLKKWNQR